MTPPTTSLTTSSWRAFDLRNGRSVLFDEIDETNCYSNAQHDIVYSRSIGKTVTQIHEYKYPNKPHRNWNRIDWIAINKHANTQAQNIASYDLHSTFNTSVSVLHTGDLTNVGIHSRWRRSSINCGCIQPINHVHYVECTLYNAVACGARFYQRTPFELHSKAIHVQAYNANAAATSDASQNAPEWQWRCHIVPDGVADNDRRRWRPSRQKNAVISVIDSDGTKRGRQWYDWCGGCIADGLALVVFEPTAPAVCVILGPETHGGRCEGGSRHVVLEGGRTDAQAVVVIELLDRRRWNDDSERRRGLHIRVNCIRSFCCASCRRCFRYKPMSFGWVSGQSHPHARRSAVGLWLREPHDDARAISVCVCVCVVGTTLSRATKRHGTHAHADARLCRAVTNVKRERTLFVRDVDMSRQCFRRYLCPICETEAMRPRSDVRRVRVVEFAMKFRSHFVRPESRRNSQ